MTKTTTLMLGCALALGAVAAGCGSSGGPTGTGGSTGNAGSKGTAGAAGNAGAGGGAGAAGSIGAAGSGGSGGAAGGAGGLGGAAGGAAGAGCTAGAPAVTPHNSCTAIPSLKQGAGVADAGGGVGDAGPCCLAPGFTISSPDFAYCGTIPAAMTCDGHAFGSGTNPSLTWSGAPAGTMSYALVFKDISLLADTTSSTAETDVNIQHGYHWAMWNIPATTTHLGTGAMTGYHSADISGALQWSQRNNYGYFPPCPNPFPQGDARFTCSLTLDSYSYTLYALPFAQLPSLPPPDLNANGEPTGNYVAKLGRYIESLSALAVTEYRGTSSAWASSFSPPSALEYPCAGDVRVDGGTRQDGGVKLDGSTVMCLQ
ncbi:MAG TPA: hypothetical protein VKZ18_12880 [Polyangia bacterium]|nr:hypothetical protein [Polyangia bacterium]